MPLSTRESYTCYALPGAGGPDAPDLSESLTNLGVNVTALVVLVFLLLRDLRSKDKDVTITQREEGLGRLLVSQCASRSRLCWHLLHDTARICSSCQSLASTM